MSANGAAHGEAHVLEVFAEKRRARHALIGKNGSSMAAAREFRPITEEGLSRVSVYQIAIESWSGKHSWNKRADESPDWPELAEEWFR